MSTYCSDLKKLVKEISNKSNFNLLRLIIHKYHSKIEMHISPIEMLKAIILHFNKKSVEPIYYKNLILTLNNIVKKK